MTDYSVILENYRTLPFLDWGRDIAAFMDEHLVDVNNKLRHQQGIVWTGLDRTRADLLGAFLIEKGVSCGLVEDKDIAELGNPQIIRNADPVDGGFELEDIWEDKSVIQSASVVLAQVGYLEEKVETGKVRKSRPTYNPQGVRDSAFSYSQQVLKTKLGWVLHIFTEGDPHPYVRITAGEFNYDYQDIGNATTSQRFGILLKDLAQVLPYESLDKGYRLSMGSCQTKPQEYVYKTLKDMLNRAEWALTIRKVLGQAAD